MEKSELLDGVKKECKKLMEEAVTKKFVHTDSSSVTSLCGIIECCLVYKLKKRAGGLLPATNNSDYILMKLAKYCDTAASVAKISTDLTNVGKEKTSSASIYEKRSDSHYLTENKLNGYTSTSFNTKYLWIRVALLEKALTTIVGSLIEHWREFYEPDALLADKVLGPSLVWLLDGPCSVDFSKMKTPDCLYSDPSSYELVQRHHICSSPSMSHTLKVTVPRRRRLFSVSSIKDNPELLGVPLLAREHVESLHQNQVSTLLYGKNNVELSSVDFHSPIQGYLSLHKSVESLLLKWTPNPMLHSNDVPVTMEKSQFWGQVITIDLVDVVYIHCHDAGDSGGIIVLVSQDGVQLPPLSFPTSASLYTFLTCLDQGLNPDGQLDPPLFNKGNFFIKWPKLRKNMFPNKLVDALKEKEKEESGTQDFVFRIVNKASSSNIDKTELRKLLSVNSSPRKLNTLKGNIQPTLIPKLHTGTRLSQHKNIVSSRVALNLACEKMKHQILSRAFNGWISSYRHLKTVRTHLASLVLPWSGDSDLPNNVEHGLTTDIWESMSSAGLSQHSETVKQYIYFGGIEPSIRKEVWPYLLSHYSFASTEQEKNELKEASSEKFNKILEECKFIEKILQEKEKELLALNGFANGESFGNIDMETESVKTIDTTDNCAFNDTLDNMSQDISLNSNISDPILDENHIENENHNAAKFSVIRSLLETRVNLREMVEKASERGVNAWKVLVRKRKKEEIKKKIDMYTSSEKFDGLHQKFVPQTESFDLEFDCQKCGKKMIESRQSVIDGKLNGDASIEAVECFSCVQERKLSSSSYDDNVSPYMIGANPSSIVYNDKLADGNDYAIINGIGTPLEETESISSVTGIGYSEETMKDFALNIHRIDKDVLRCDRNHPYFESEKNLEKLRNIIICYVWESLSIGYIQGMCDLCAPLLVVMDDEAEVYACFLKLMERMSNNFPHGNAMDLHLSNIGSLIQILDPELHEILEGHGDCTIFYFCYRWFLLDFKRELQYEDVYLVWETIWAASSLSSEHFNLFVALAIIELYREIIIDNKMDFTDIIKFFNEMAEQHDAQATLNLARNIVQKLQDIMHQGDPLME